MRTRRAFIKGDSRMITDFDVCACVRVRVCICVCVCVCVCVGVCMFCMRVHVLYVCAFVYV